LDLTGLRIFNLTIIGVNFSDAVLKEVSAIQVRFIRTPLFKADLKKGVLRGAVISGSDATSADFSFADLRGLKVSKSHMVAASFAHAQLQASTFVDTALDGADFSGADLRDAVILSSSLKGAVFDCETKLPFARDLAIALGMRPKAGDLRTCP
jgi:uncharacterized protein YjbI with pentapeptide repeats